jgi:hypothetical protein
MEYAHWLIVAGAVLVVLGFIGFALHKNDAEPAEGHLTRDTSSETIQAAREKAEAALAACRTQISIFGSCTGDLGFIEAAPDGNAI